jgi:hypothetical protein
VAGQGVAGGRWQVADGRWQVAGGRWQVAGGRWQVAGGRWQVAGAELLVQPLREGFTDVCSTRSESAFKEVRQPQQPCADGSAAMAIHVSRPAPAAHLCMSAMSFTKLPPPSVLLSGCSSGRLSGQVLPCCCI